MDRLMTAVNPESIKAAAGVTGSWTPFFWSIYDPLHSVLQILALAGSIAVSYFVVRHYIKKDKYDPEE